MWYRGGKLSKGLIVLVFVVTLLTFTAWQSGGVGAQGIGIYAGGHETAGGMGSTVSYSYFLELKADNSYEIKSYFLMGNALYDFTETGTYVLNGSKLTITPTGQEAIEGSVNNDGTVTISVKPSQMASKRTESTLTLSTNPVAGVYRATLQGPTVVEATLYLTHQGQYFYLAVPSNDTAAVHEKGTYSVNGTELAFQIADSADSFKGTVDGSEIAAPFIVSAVMGMRMEIKLGLK